MKIKLSRSDWKIIGKKTGWLKQAKSVEKNGVIYINVEDFGRDFWGHTYKIQLGAIGTRTYIVNAGCDGDAIDELIDYLEVHNPGMFLSKEEEAKRAENINSGKDDEYADNISGGNHGRTLNVDYSEMSIRALSKQEVEAIEPFSWYFEEEKKEEPK